MTKLLYSATASLDGYIAGPDGDMSWLTPHLTAPNPTATNPVVERVLAGTGALLVGNVTYRGDDPNRGTEREGAFGGRYDGPVVVVTHDPPATAPGAVVFASDLPTAVELAIDAAAGAPYVNVLGADVAGQLIDAGRLDEILVFFAPVLLGAGTPLFSRRRDTDVRLTPLTDDDAHWYRVDDTTGVRVG